MCLPLECIVTTVGYTLHWILLIELHSKVSNYASTDILSSKHACYVCHTFVFNLDSVRMRFCLLSFILLEAVRSFAVTGNHVSVIRSRQFCVKTSTSSIFCVRWMLTSEKRFTSFEGNKVQWQNFRNFFPSKIETCWWVVEAVNIATGNEVLRCLVSVWVQ